MSILMAVLFCFQTGAAVAAENKGLRKPTVMRRAVVEQKAPETESTISLTPSDGALINNAKPVIAAEYMDDGIGVSTTDTKLLVDGQDVSAAAQILQNKITYAPAAPLADGNHKAKLDIVDKAGNTVSTLWSFTIHTLPPLVKITSHKPNQFLNHSPVQIAGTVNDSRARIVVNGVVAAVEKETFSARVNLVEGTNSVTATVTDAFGNTGSDTVVLVVDSKPPVINITSPSSNSLLSTGLVTVTGTADKNVAAVTVATRSGQEVPAVLAAGAFTAKDVKVDEGANILVVKAVSLAGNTGSSTVRFTVDTIAPVITLTAPKEMTVTNRKMITVTGMVDDQTAMVKISNTPVQLVKGSFTLSSVNLTEGRNTITATAVDRAGNQATPAVINVLLKTTPPASPTLNPLPPVTRTSPLTLTGTTEPGAKVDVYVNSSTKTTVKADEKGAFSLQLMLTEGNNGITAIAYDEPGNASAPSPVLNVFLDTKPPKIL
jgi:hypothetical protein